MYIHLINPNQKSKTFHHFSDFFSHAKKRLTEKKTSTLFTWKKSNSERKKSHPSWTLARSIVFLILPWHLLIISTSWKKEPFIVHTECNIRHFCIVFVCLINIIFVKESIVLTLQIYICECNYKTTNIYIIE